MRLGYLVIAVSLTVLDGFVTVQFGRCLWLAWSGSILIRSLLVLMAILEAVSLANIWRHTISRCLYDLETRGTASDVDALILSIEPQGEQDV